MVSRLAQRASRRSTNGHKKPGLITGLSSSLKAPGGRLDIVRLSEYRENGSQCLNRTGLSPGVGLVAGCREAGRRLCRWQVLISAAGRIGRDLAAAVRCLGAAGRSGRTGLLASGPHGVKAARRNVETRARATYNVLRVEWRRPFFNGSLPCVDPSLLVVSFCRARLPQPRGSPRLRLSRRECERPHPRARS